MFEAMRRYADRTSEGVKAEGDLRSKPNSQESTSSRRSGRKPVGTTRL